MRSVTARSWPHTASSSCSRLKTTPGPAHEEFEQPEFGGGERDFIAAETHLAAGAVELQIADFQKLGGGRLPAEMNLDARDQFADEEGLDDVVIGAQLQTHDAIGFGSAGGQENDGSMRELRMRPNGLADLQSVGIRQHDVENDKVGLFAAAELDGALAGREPVKAKPSFSRLYWISENRSASSSMSTIFFIL